MINICEEEKVLATLMNIDSKQYAAWLHMAIQQILQENDIEITQLKAIGVTIGPGSYTGIRVGMATAKGLCYALKIPLITYNVLQVMALSAIENIANKNGFYCPMIDARRMEVFTAIYNYDLEELMPQAAMILTDHSFEEISSQQTVYFFGSGSDKFKHINNSFHFHFTHQEITSEQFCKLSWQKYKRSEFSSVAYAEPIYIKEFYSTQEPAK